MDNTKKAGKDMKTNPRSADEKYTALQSAVRKVLPILYRAVEFEPYASDEFRDYQELAKLVSGD